MIRGIPKHMEDYISVHYSLSLELHEKFYPPKYIFGDYVYFKRTKEIEEYIDKLEKK